MAKRNCLLEANELVHGARQDDYGHPLDDFSKTAALTTVVLSNKLKPGETIAPEEVALIMICVKLSRLLNTPDHHDSIVDIPGYALTYEMVLEEKARRA